MERVFLKTFSGKLESIWVKSLCAVKVSCSKFFFSATVTESDELSSKFPETVAEQENNEDEDEADIREYLTLSQLGNILRELSVKGKNNTRLP